MQQIQQCSVIDNLLPATLLLSERGWYDSGEGGVEYDESQAEKDVMRFRV